MHCAGIRASGAAYARVFLKKAGFFFSKKHNAACSFATGNPVELIAKPIIGPPEIHFTAAPSFKEKVSGIKSLIKVPIGTRILQGFSTAPPEIVRLRSIKGIPRRNASLIAQTIPTLQIMQPASAGSFALGISIQGTIQQ